VPWQARIEQRSRHLASAGLDWCIDVTDSRPPNRGPESPCLRAADLVLLIQDSIAINIPMAETGWTLPMEFSPRGCCIVDEPTKGPDGEWLH